MRDANKKRQKNIKIVERQLLKATTPTMELPSTSKSDDFALPSVASTKTYLMSERRMVAPGAKDAPRFKSSKPEELRRFIRLMEDLWKEAGVTNDRTKKTMIGKYADQDSEEEWAAFDTYEDGHSWDDFKEELIENYPEAAAAERGTPAKIKKICSETDKIALGDLIAFYSFRRSFLSEAKKLLKPPAVMANRELVELFIGCLTDAFASAVIQYLGNQATDSKTTTSKGKQASSIGNVVSRRPEDRYDLEEVCQAALKVSENSQGMYNLINKTERSMMLFTQPVSENKALAEKLNELEGEQALDKDRLVSLGKTLEAKIGGIEDLIKNLVKSKSDHEAQNNCKGDCKGGNDHIHEANSAPAQRWGGKSYENEKCFWCGLFGHFQADCEDLKAQLRLGTVKMNHEGKLRMKDGSFIPRYPLEASLKERLEKHNARKPSQFFYGEYDDSDPVPSAAPNILSQLLGSSNEADKRTIAQLKAEIDLRKREEALELKQKMLEQNEKKSEQASGSTRAAAVLELLGQLSDDDVAAIKSAKSGFI